MNQAKVKVDEGLLMNVLHTASRHGLPSLASEVLTQMEKQNLPLHEHHIVHILDACAANGDIKQAFQTLDLWCASGKSPTLADARSILSAIQRDPDSIDMAYGYLEELKETGQTIDVVAVNVIIQAAVFLNDLQRAVGTYKAMGNLDVKPDATTFNLLLKACVNVEHRELGDGLFSEMKAAHIRPNSETYKHLISLNLTQSDYEESFYYLEEMKAKGLKPPLSCYDAIIRKCVSTGDTRYRLAMEELEQMGYVVPHSLLALVEGRANVH